jgi:hypothetical protein
LAAAEHPGLRLALPAETLARRCVNEHHLLPSVGEMAELYPAHLPDASAVKALLKAEAEEMRRIRQELTTVRYRRPGKRGAPTLVSFDPAHIADIEAAMVEKFGAGVTVELPEEIEMEQRKELPAEVPVEQKIERPMIGRPLERRPRRRTVCLR